MKNELNEEFVGMVKTMQKLKYVYPVFTGFSKKRQLLDYVIYKPFLGWVSSMKNNYIVM